MSEWKGRESLRSCLSGGAVEVRDTGSISAKRNLLQRRVWEMPGVADKQISVRICCVLRLQDRGGNTMMNKTRYNPNFLEVVDGSRNRHSLSSM